MSKKHWIPAIAGLFAIVATASSAFAQTPIQIGSGERGQNERGGSTSATGNPLGDAINAPTRESTTASRLSRRASTSERPRRGQPQPAPAATPEQIRAAAQAQLTAAGVACNLTEATNPGLINEAQVYEVACANAPGQILIASTPPQAFDCIELAGTAALVRANDPAADVGQQCALPANQNGLQVMGGWARSAGADCTIDQAQAVGKNGANMVYEIGCANADGYWLEKAANNVFTLTPCLQVTSQAGVCRFTTAQEIAASFQPKLAGTEAAGCAVTQVRLMGSNANGSFYETKCAADGEGYIARLNAEGATQQVYPCATAQRIGGGCTLTPAPAAATSGGRP